MGRSGSYLFLRYAMRGTPPAVDAEEIPLSTVRRLTAERLAASAREVPHFYLTVVAAADKLLAFRAQANERRGADVKITVTDLLIRACATALAAHPAVNSSWDKTRILRHRHVNIGVAVAIDDGLIVPVIRDADGMILTGIAREAHDLTARARARKLTPDELSGGTFTISNLGMYGIRQFTAVINPPQAAILAVGEAVRQPVVRDDQVAIATTMTLTLSIDHRAVDGATAARLPHPPQGTDRGAARHRALRSPGIFTTRNLFKLLTVVIKREVPDGRYHLRRRHRADPADRPPSHGAAPGPGAADRHGLRRGSQRGPVPAAGRDPARLPGRGDPAACRCGGTHPLPGCGEHRPAAAGWSVRSFHEHRELAYLASRLRPGVDDAEAATFWRSGSRRCSPGTWRR